MADTKLDPTDTATREMTGKPVIASHTPGPWRIAGDGDHEEIELCCVESATHDAIAIVADAHTDHGDPLPNARLIAAAPDLLDAAKQMQGLMDNLWKAVPWGKTAGLRADLLNEAPLALQQAIAKAEGR